MSMESTGARCMMHFDPDIALIETMCLEPGHHIPLRPYHIRRLQTSAQALGFALNLATLEQQLHTYCMSLDAYQTWRIRLLLHRNGLITLESSLLAPTKTPVECVTTHTPVPSNALWLRHKTTYRPLYDAATRWLAQHPDVFDVLFLNEYEQVCEGSRSTVYIKDPDHALLWLTPPLSCGVLPGVQRQFLIDQGLVREAQITRYDLACAPQLRLSNALRGWLDTHWNQNTTAILDRI